MADEKAGELDRLSRHLRAVLARKHEAGHPTCADEVPDLDKLAAVGEEFGEVCRALQDEPSRLGEELLDLAAAAVLWENSIGVGAGKDAGRESPVRAQRQGDRADAAPPSTPSADSNAEVAERLGEAARRADISARRELQPEVSDLHHQDAAAIRLAAERLIETAQLEAAAIERFKERLVGLDWQEVNADAERRCPSRDHRPFGCARCVVEAAINTVSEEEEN